jgi:hypothetical protein
MTKYVIIAKRETMYEFQVEADSENDAISQVEQIELTEDIENYAYDWFPLEIEDVEEEEEE